MQASNYIRLAKALPPRLQVFLARYPATAILPDGATSKTGYQEETPNPFSPMKHAATGNWHNPKYSMRRQAELVKLARDHGVEELLPFTHKATEERIRKRVELGLRVKGTGVGQKVKGHKYERQLEDKYGSPFIRAMVPPGSWWQRLLTCFGQDGQEEKGNAPDARAHPRVERGMALSKRPFQMYLESANWRTRLEKRIGQSGRNSLLSCSAGAVARKALLRHVSQAVHQTQYTTRCYALAALSDAMFLSWCASPRSSRAMISTVLYAGT